MKAKTHLKNHLQILKKSLFTQKKNFYDVFLVVFFANIVFLHTFAAK